MVGRATWMVVAAICVMMTVMFGYWQVQNATLDSFNGRSVGFGLANASDIEAKLDHLTRQFHSIVDSLTVLPGLLDAKGQNLDTKGQKFVAPERLRGPVNSALINPTVLRRIAGGKRADPVHVAAEKCDSFVGSGFICFIEAPEHALVKKWLPADATVMEFGARFGSTSCEIAKKLQNSGRLVSVEPDRVVWDWFETNLANHNCHGYLLRGAIGTKPMASLGSGYGGMSKPVDVASPGAVPTVTFRDIERVTGFTFDTLLIDCEGCAQFMMDELGDVIKYQIKLILLEADMPNTGGDCRSNCMDYAKFFDFVERSGFERIDKFNDCDQGRTLAPKGTWCGGWIEHYAYRRK